jgi:hypothetical protein
MSPKRTFLTLPGWPLERGGSPVLRRRMAPGHPATGGVDASRVSPAPTVCDSIGTGRGPAQTTGFSLGAVSGFFFGFQFTLSTAGNRCDVTPSIGGRPGALAARTESGHPGCKSQCLVSYLNRASRTGSYSPLYVCLGCKSLAVGTWLELPSEVPPQQPSLRDFLAVPPRFLSSLPTTVCASRPGGLPTLGTLHQYTAFWKIYVTMRCELGFASLSRRVCLITRAI